MLIKLQYIGEKYNIFLITRDYHEVAPQKVQRTLDLAVEKGSSVWLTVLPLSEMELENNGVLAFLGIQLINKSLNIETKVYVKPSSTGLLLHYESHVDARYKSSLIATMLQRAWHISSSWQHFTDECERLEIMFCKLKYV